MNGELRAALACIEDLNIKIAKMELENATFRRKLSAKLTRENIEDIEALKLNLADKKMTIHFLKKEIDAYKQKQFNLEQDLSRERKLNAEKYVSKFEIGGRMARI